MIAVYPIYIVFIRRICWCLHVDDFFATCVISGILVKFHQGNGFTAKHKRSARILCQCDTNPAGHSPLMHIHQDPLLVYLWATDVGETLAFPFITEIRPPEYKMSLYHMSQNISAWLHIITVTLRERHYDWNYQQLGCFSNCLFRRTSKKTSKPILLALFEGNSPLSGDSPQKGPWNIRVFSVTHHYQKLHMHFVSILPWVFLWILIL